LFHEDSERGRRALRRFQDQEGRGSKTREYLVMNRQRARAFHPKEERPIRLSSLHLQERLEEKIRESGKVFKCLDIDRTQMK